MGQKQEPKNKMVPKLHRCILEVGSWSSGKKTSEAAVKISNFFLSEFLQHDPPFITCTGDILFPILKQHLVIPLRYGPERAFCTVTALITSPEFEEDYPSFHTSSLFPIETEWLST